MTDSATLLKAIAVTAEAMGTELSPGALRLFASDLAAYPLPAVLTALTRCRREIRGRLSIADVVARIDDGRPGVEAAWAMLPKDEDESGVMTEGEMAVAWGVARPLLAAGDFVAARMAFKESYERAVAEARAAGRPVKWFASLGHDPMEREAVLSEAVRLNRLSAAHAQSLLPHLDPDGRKLDQPTAVGRILQQLEHRHA